MEGEWFETIVAGWTWGEEFFRSGQGLPLVMVGVVVVLLVYLMGLLLPMIIPIWRRYKSPH